MRAEVYYVLFPKSRHVPWPIFNITSAKAILTGTGRKTNRHFLIIRIFFIDFMCCLLPLGIYNVLYLNALFSSRELYLFFIIITIIGQVLLKSKSLSCHRHSCEKQLQRLCEKRLDLLRSEVVEVAENRDTGRRLTRRWVPDPSMAMGKMYVSN